MNCPASVLLEDALPRTTNPFAEEGTYAHELAQALLIGSKLPDHTEDMLKHVQTYIDFIEAEKEEGDLYVVEERLDLTHLAPDMGGTLDFGRWRPRTKELLIVDLKYGAGQFVAALGNKQGMSYASGLAKFFGVEPETIRIVIVQPRQENPVRQWTLDGLSLFDFEQDVIKAASLAFGPDPSFKAGPWCRWCKAAATCPELLMTAREKATSEFQEFATNPVTNHVDPDEIGAALKLARQLELWAKAVEDIAAAEAKDGRLPTGFDWVPTRPTKTWIDEDETKRFLGGAGIDAKLFMNAPKIRTPKQVQDAVVSTISAEDFKALVEQAHFVSGGHKLVPLDGKKTRPSLTAAVEELAGEVDFLS